MLHFSYQLIVALRRPRSNAEKKKKKKKEEDNAAPFLVSFRERIREYSRRVCQAHGTRRHGVGRQIRRAVHSIQRHGRKRWLPRLRRGWEVAEVGRVGGGSGGGLGDCGWGRMGEGWLPAGW